MTHRLQLAAILLLLLVSGYGGVKTTMPTNLLGGIYRGFVRVTNPQLHGLNGYKGVDIAGGCGTPLYAPFGGTIEYQGLDGYNHLGVWPQNTMLVLTNGLSKLTLLHGDYVVKVGQQVDYGDLLGYEASKGWSTGCHSHVVFQHGGITLNPLTVGQKPLLITWYDPALGGINAWGDGTVYRNGERVLPSHYGNTAACIEGWLGATLTIDGRTWTCRDTGGGILEGAWYYRVDLLLKTEPEYNLNYLFNYLK